MVILTNKFLCLFLRGGRDVQLRGICESVDARLLIISRSNKLTDQAFYFTLAPKSLDEYDRTVEL
jgi:hypothetical protein